MREQFLTNISHEIRSPLGVILGLSELFKDPSVLPEERMKFIEIISKNGANLLTLVEDILDLSKIEAGNLNLVVAVKCINGPAPAIGVSSLALLIGILLMGVTEQVLTTADVWTAQFFMLGFMCEKQLGLARQARQTQGLAHGNWTLQWH